MTLQALAVHETAIDGLLVIDLPLHEDNRGWFKENWQRAKMTALGLPDFGPVQNNMSFNSSAGSTRGLHAEPWEKLVSVAHGRVFGAWVDLREGPGFGASFTLELGTDKAVYVPRGVANGYQALAASSVYSYLVNEHWSPEARGSYTYVNPADETLAIPWPISLERAEISEADLRHPRLADVKPVAPRRTVVVGANGQLGRALMARLPDALPLARPEFDLSDDASFDRVSWAQVGLIVNAAAHTAVDAAESEQGRRDCWETNVTGLGRLVRRAREHRIPLVHVSSDYVFDGRIKIHSEDEALSPLGVYGQTKAAGEALVETLPEHWIVRTSWVIGEGDNFVRTMAGLADRGATPKVVADQFGRLTFADDLADAILGLARRAAPGTFNFTNGGPSRSWAEIAKRVFELRGRSPSDVLEVAWDEYAAGGHRAPRPRHSTLDLSKIRGLGIEPVDAFERLTEYCEAINAP